MSELSVLSVHSLLQHEPFVRAVVRGVLLDEGQTQDVVQETWLTALRRPPRSEGALRPWLARVARNLARDRRRGDGRRARREQAAARPERVESVEESQGRLEAQREVVDSVLALAEPYRSVVLLRYYQDCTPAEIAQRLGRSPATVRSQLSRAHEILRAGLDAKFDGGRDEWMGLLAPLGLGVATQPVAKLTTATVLKLSVTLAGVALLALVIGPRLGADDAAQDAPQLVTQARSGRTAPAAVAPARSVEPRVAGSSMRASAATPRSTAAVLQGATQAPARHLPRERHNAYAHLSGGERYASQEIQVERLPDGNYRYEIEARVLIDLLASRKEIGLRGEYVVTPELRPVSVHVESEDLKQRQLVTGQVTGDTLHLSFEPALPEREATLRFDLSAERLIFAVCVEDWLATLDPETSDASVAILDDATWELATVLANRVRRDEHETQWELEYSNVETPQSMTFDERGVLTRAALGDPPQPLELCTFEQALDLTPLDLNGPDVLVFPIGRTISAPQQLERLTIELTWQDIELSQFDLEDEHQRLVEATRSGVVQRALLELRPPPPIDQSVKLPVRDAQLAPYLEESEFIKPHDAQILALAEEITAQSSNAADAARALARWVFEYIEGDLIVETLSGPEVLVRKTGKCTEYATLFASLARAVGLPTRVALGERMVGEYWMGHMWNEVWIGRWLTVDASANEIGASFALLKFVHSATLEGTQPLRWALTESLAIAITDVELRQSSLAHQYRDGIDGVTFTSTDYAAQIAAPASTWKLVDNSAAGRAGVSFEPPQAEGFALNFVAFPLQAGMEPASLSQSRLNYWKGHHGGVELLDDAAREVQGAGGHTFRFRVAGKDGAAHVYTTEVCWVRGKVGYLLAMNALAPAYEKWGADYEKLLASFRFLDE